MPISITSIRSDLEKWPQLPVKGKLKLVGKLIVILLLIVAICAVAFGIVKGIYMLMDTSIPDPPTQPPRDQYLAVAME